MSTDDPPPRSEASAHTETRSPLDTPVPDPGAVAASFIALSVPAFGPVDEHLGELRSNSAVSKTRGFPFPGSQLAVAPEHGPSPRYRQGEGSHRVAVGSSQESGGIRLVHCGVPSR
jgi:hypothetical protein